MERDRVRRRDDLFNPGSGSGCRDSSQRGTAEGVAGAPGFPGRARADPSLPGRVRRRVGATPVAAELRRFAELIPYGGWVVKGCPRARAARLYGPAPPASRVLRIAARRPAAALDPGASAGPGAGAIGQAGACPMGARSPSPLLWVDRVVVIRAGSSAGKVASFVDVAVSGVRMTCHAAVCGLLRGLPPLLLLVGC